MAGVAVGNALEIILMLGLGLPEVACSNHFGHDLPRPQAGRIDVLDCVFGDPLLRIAREKDRRSIPGADVVALAIARARVMDLEEEPENPPVADAGGIEQDFDGLGMPGMVAIGGVGDRAAGVAHTRGEDALHLADEFLHPPKASACKYRAFLGH
jgi:hypothetical protein